MLRYFLLVVIFLVNIIFSFGLFAQELLDEAVITANRLPQKQAQTAKVLTILPDSVLRQYESQTLSQLLNAQTGLWILGANSAPGTNQNIYMRGAGVGYVSVLLNGIPVSDPSTPIGNFDINVIPLAQLGRVEILKGTHSVIYGSDAIAGVINLLPRREFSGKHQAFMHWSGGSYGNVQLSAGVMGKIKGFQYGVQYAQQFIKGFSAAYDSLDTHSFDSDTMRRQTANVHFSQQIGKKITLRGMGQYAAYRADLDAAPFQDDKDYTTNHRHITAGIGLDAQLAGIDIHSNYAFYDTERLYLDDSTDVPPLAFNRFSDAHYQSQTHFAELYGSRKIGKHLELLLGGDYRSSLTDQSYLSISDYGIYEEPPISSDSAKIAQYSGYASLLLRDIAGINIELGSRFNAHQLYGGHLTYSAGVSRWIATSYKLFGSVSSGFRAPSLYQLFSPYGNRQLKPETAFHLEGGVQYVSENGHHSARLLGFGRNVDQVIVATSLPDFSYRYINLEKQRDYGIEVDISSKFKKINVNFGYAFVTGNVTIRDTLIGVDTIYNNLIRRPSHRITLNLGYAISPKWSAELRLQAAGKRQDLFFDESTFSSVPKEMAGFILLDLHVSGKLTPNITFFTELRNLTNVQYFETIGYNTRRFNADVGISVVLN